MPRPFICPCRVFWSQILGPAPYPHPIVLLPLRLRSRPSGPAPCRPRPTQAAPTGLTPQPSCHAPPQPQHLVHVRADRPLQGRKQLILFGLEGTEPRGGPSQDCGVKGIQELPTSAAGNPRAGAQESAEEAGSRGQRGRKTASLGDSGGESKAGDLGPAPTHSSPSPCVPTPPRRPCLYLGPGPGPGSAGPPQARQGLSSQSRQQLPHQHRGQHLQEAGLWALLGPRGLLRVPVRPRVVLTSASEPSVTSS